MPQLKRKGVFFRTSSGRKWFLAAILSFMMPGLGQIYNGQAEKGLLLYALFSMWGSLFISVTLNALKTSYERILVFLMFLIFAIYLVAWALTIFDAIRAARIKGRSFKLRVYNRWYYYFLAILLNLVIYVTLRDTIKSVLLKPYNITSVSMYPTLQEGDYVLTDPLTYAMQNPQRADVIVMIFPKDGQTVFIKRIIGMPGDTLAIIDKQVYVNGEMLTENYIRQQHSGKNSAGAAGRNDFGPVVIGAGEYFVMGDNRDSSYDSRHWGPVPRENIIGRPGIIYLSLRPEFPYIQWNRLGMKLE